MAFFLSYPLLMVYNKSWLTTNLVMASVYRQVSKRQKREPRGQLLLSGKQQKHAPRGGCCLSKGMVDEGEFDQIKEHNLKMRVDGKVCA
jgi:hypothetical protein